MFFTRDPDSLAELDGATDAPEDTVSLHLAAAPGWPAGRRHRAHLGADLPADSFDSNRFDGASQEYIVTADVA